MLDFGLAKALAEDPETGDLATSPTITEVATRGRVILGTAAYMIPGEEWGD